MSPDKGAKPWILAILQGHYASNLFLKLMRTFALIFRQSKTSGKNFFYFYFLCLLNKDKFEKFKDCDLWTSCGLSLFTKQSALTIASPTKNRPLTRWSLPLKSFDGPSRTPATPTPGTKRCNPSRKLLKILLRTRPLISFQSQRSSSLTPK